MNFMCLKIYGKFMCIFIWCIHPEKVTYVDEKPPSIDATYNNGFSATSAFNAQSSINGGINGQSSVASTLNAQSPLGSVDAQSAVQSSIETGPQKTVHVQKLKKHLHHRHHLWPSHSNVSI